MLKPLPVSNTALFAAAQDARRHSHSPYSQFKVGAAIVTKSGKVFVGTNIENASFGLTQCAERQAVGAAITAGEREFEKILLVSDGGKCVSPCGACRQVLMEFAPQIEVVLADSEDSMRTLKIAELLPQAFREIP